MDIESNPPGKRSVENIDFDFEKVLKNVSNLISEKATAKGLELTFGIEPSISSHFKGEIGKMVHFSVSDTGIGLTEERWGACSRHSGGRIRQRRGSMEAPDLGLRFQNSWRS